MFYRTHRCQSNNTFFFILSLIAAFMLGRKSHECGLTIISQGCRVSNYEKGSKSKGKERDKNRDNDKNNDIDDDSALVEGH